MRVDTNQMLGDQPMFISLDEAGLEESPDRDPVHGIYHSNEGSIYSYVAWFYDEDEGADGSAFSVM